MRLRAGRCAGFAGVVACALALGAACSKSPATATDTDAGGPPTNEDAGDLDTSLGIVIDALPGVPIDSSPPEGDASDGAAVSPPVEASVCAKPYSGAPCGVDPQCDCASSQTCDYGGGATAACIVAGNAPLGHGCASTASCAPGLTCFNGACRPYCSAEGDAGCAAKLPEGGTCEAVSGADGGPVPGYDICTFDCQLQDPNACGPNGSLNAGCVSNGVGGTDCEDVGILGVGATCQYLNDCLPGLVCAGTCFPWCRIAASPSDCSGGATCEAFSGGAVMANGIEYGYCP
jgi:hypothetical protein